MVSFWKKEDLRSINAEFVIFIFMVFDVVVNHLGRDVSGTHRKESSCPEMLSPIPFAERRKLLLEFAGARSLHELHEFAQGEVRGVREEKVDVLGGNHAGHDYGIILGTYPADELPQAYCHGSGENGIAVLRDPDDMRFEIVQAM